MDNSWRGDPLSTRIAALLPAMRARASRGDVTATFPAEDIDALRRAGLLASVLPRALGGRGLGTEHAGAGVLARVLALLGRGSIAVGRLFEGHVNGARLICRYGSPALVRAFATDVHDGHLSAIWNTEAGEGVRAEPAPDGHVLRGRKLFCSGAGHVTRPVVTARDAGGSRLVLLRLAQGARVGAPDGEPLGVPLGVRAAATGAMELEGLFVPAADVFGAAGDYLREPDFSAGAWRASAVALGGVGAIAAATREALSARGRDAAPAQRARIGRLLIAEETARLWVARAADIAEDPSLPTGDVAGYVNLARTAVETVAMEAIALATRAVGLAAFVPPAPLERLIRDLSTYLRQPAPDEALDEAAAWFTSVGLDNLNDAAMADGRG